MQSTLSRFVSVGLSLVAIATGSRATIVVDAAGGGDYTSLAEAIAAAPDGEQILVKAGDYVANGQLLISGKGLSLCAEAGAVVKVMGLHVTSLPAGRWVVVRGLQLDPVAATPFFPLTPGTVHVEGPGGAVLLEDCTILGDNGYADSIVFFPVGPSPAVVVNAGGAATLERCTLQGGKGWHATGGPNKWGPGNGAPGLLASNGRAALHGCAATGGDVGGGNPQLPVFVPPQGGAGLQSGDSGFVHAAGSTVTGGKNGSNTNIPDDMTGDGLLTLTGGSAWVRDCTLQPGPLDGAGLLGQSINATPGSVTTFAAPARSLAVTSPLREGQVGTLQIEGEQGDQITLLVTLGVGYAPLSGKQGVFGLDTSLLFLPVSLGTISDPGGSLAIPFVTPNLNPVLEGLMVPMQLVATHSGVTTLEATTALLWLDATL